MMTDAPFVLHRWGVFHRLRPEVTTGTWQQIWDNKVPKSLLSDLKNIARQLQEGERKSPWSEWEIKHILQGEIWPGISYTDASNLNPLREQQRQTPTESDSAAPVPSMPVVLPRNSNFVRLAGLTNESTMQASQQQFQEFVNVELAVAQEEPANKRPRHENQADPELPAVEGEADGDTEAEPSKAPPPWNGRVIGMGKSKKGALSTHAFVWFFDNRSFPSTENHVVPIADLGAKLKASCVPSCMQDPSEWTDASARKQTEKDARKWLTKELRFKPGKRVAVNFGASMDNATIDKVQKDGKIVVDYDDGTVDYTTWDPLSPKRDWRCIELGLDDASDLTKPEGDESSNSDDSDT